MTNFIKPKRLLTGGKLLIGRRNGFCFFLLLSSLFFFSSASAQLVRSAAGANAAAIQAAVDQYRTDLGTLNPNVAGSFGTGRREINWDGVPNALAAPNNLPANFFNVNSPRGAVFSGPGTGFQVSANAGIAPIEFDNINPTYSALFAVFSRQRLFTALESTVYDVSFFVPGSTTPATVRGFGAVFTDVDLANTSSIQYFDKDNNSLGTFFVPNATGNETLSFLGVSFAAASIARVRVTQGNLALGAANLETPTADLVVVDDFLYGEPVACPTINVDIPDAFALPSGVLPNTVYIGFDPASSLTLTSVVSGGSEPYSLTWSNGSHASSITVSPTVTTTFTLDVLDKNGCPGTASKTVSVVDIRGGKNLNKVIICHKPGKIDNTLTIGQEAVDDHLDHGDNLGSCSTSPGITVRQAGTVEENSLAPTLEVKVTSNPSVSYFTLYLQSGNKERIQLRVVDLQGRLIERKENLQPNQAIRVGSTYRPGLYFVEIEQGRTKKQLQLIKTN